MSLVTVARRRVRPHLATWLAVLASVLVTATTVGALTLLGGAIGDASTRGIIAAAPPADRSVVLTTTVAAGDRPAADAAVSAVLAPLGDTGLRTVVATSTSRGIEGAPENARALLAELSDPAEHADLVTGQWPPAATADLASQPGEALHVALHDGAARALGVGVGSTLALADLLDAEAPTRPVLVVGTYLPRDVADAVWEELPIAREGTTTTEFETYGPFLLGAGSFDRGAADSATVTWRMTPRVAGGDAPAMAAMTSQVRRALDLARAAASRDEAGAVPVLRGAQAGSALPDLLEEAGVLAARAQAAMLTPTFLLLLLGGTALAVSVSLLALLREAETRLLRTRGAGAGQIARMALLEGLVIAGSAALAGLILAPALATLVASRAGLATESLTPAAGMREPRLLVLLALVAGLALVTIVVTTVVRSRDSPRGVARPGLVRVLAGAGVDVALLGLGLLAFLQLRRYLQDPTPALDPVTAAAPGLLVAALAVGLLRVLPLLARVVGRVAERGSLPVAWGGWQVARRIGSQAGALLLILLAVPISVLAVSQQATTARAIEDQSRFAVGADLRVEPRPDAIRAPDHVARLAAAAGGRERVMPAARETMTLGSLDRVTVLRVDATTAGAVARPRADLSAAGDDWPDLMARLARARPSTSAQVGILLPDDATTARLSLSLGLRDAEAVFGAGPEADEIPQPSGLGTLVITDADGQTWASGLGRVGDGSSVEVDLAPGLPRPLSITAVQVTTNLAWISDEQGPLLQVGLSGVSAGGVDLPVDGLEQAVVREGRATLLAPRPEVPPPPVVLTAAVADDLEVATGDLTTLAVRGQPLDVEVVGVVDALPTALDPDRGVVADLATLDAAAITASGDRVLAGTAPREFWLAPADLASAEAALRADPALAARALTTDGVAAARAASPVHAGLGAALLLVGLSAVLLAALGFAATTAAVGRTRRHESAVLHALGLAPRQIRGTVLLERWAVIALAVGAGTLVGVLVTYAVVPLLVGGDGHPLVPDVVPVIPWPAVALVAAVTSACLVAGTLVAARQVTSELSVSLREGADR